MKHAITLLFVCLSLAIQSQTYNLDNNFNTDGYWISQAAADDRGYDVAVQADGKIVSVGGIGKLTNPSDAHCIVTRLNPDGTPDAGFGAGGTVQFRFDNASSIAYAMAMQPDGKILVLASIIGAGIGVARLLPDGKFDASFHSTGKYTLPFADVYFAGEETPMDICLQSDGKILVAFPSFVEGNTFSVATVVRLLSDGKMDTTFSNDGIAFADAVVNAHDVVSGVTTFKDHIYVCGYTKFSGKSNFTLYRFTTNGSLASFSQGGAASRMEAGLSRESANDTLESLIRGEDSVFSVQSIISYKKKERFFEFPQIKFRESLKKLGHLKSEELLKLHLGKKDKLLEHKLTGMELAALLPLHFTMSAPREFPNFLTPERELLHFSGFADNLPNGNAVLFGPSGKGKSMMLANLFAYIMEETNSEIIILDNGRGFENFVRAYGGKTFEMTSEAVPVGLNLCQILSGFDKNFRAECLTDFTRFLINSRGEINNLILSRMKRLATLNFPKNLNHWQKMLNENQCEEIAEQILPFVHGEIYGDHFDAPISADLNSRILYFTGPMISPGQNNPLIIPYFFVVNLLVASRASFSDKHPPAIVCWDEAAWLMNHAPNVVSSMWNCMRKTGNSVIASAQHPGQITVHSSGRDILENSPTRWILGLSEGISELDHIMEINSSEKRALGVRRPGDFFLVGREAQKYWVSFLQSPLHYALFTTSKKERVEIEKLINEENQGTAQQKVIQACTRWSLSKVKAGMLTVFLILGFIRPASAFWGIGDTSDPILLGILQQSTQQVAALIQQIELARRHYYEFQSVYKDARKVLNDLKTATEVLTSNKREYSGAREKLEAVKMIMRSADSMKNLPDEIQRKINSIGEAVVYQDKQSQMAEVFRGFGVEISDQARGASVGVAEKLTAQGIGLQLQTLADISRGQAEILRLAAIDEARKVKAEAGEQMLQGQLADLRNLNPGQTIRRPY
jgi:uncharacterized delta-60 repeat protein